MFRSAEDYISLYEKGTPDEWKQVMRNGIASEEVWQSILDSRPELAEAVVLNKFLPDSILSLLAKNKDRRIRYLLAMKNKLPLEVIEILSSDRDAQIRLMISRTCNVPQSVLFKLVNDNDVSVSCSAKEMLSNNVK